MVYKFFNVICKSQIFEVLVVLSIVLNTVSLSMDRYPIDPDELLVLETINFICTWIFIGEMIMKILGLGLKTYVIDDMNRFDAIVVIISIVELILE